MTAYCRCTRITHLFSDKGREENLDVPHSDQQASDKARQTSQGYSKGNVAIFPQDIATLRTVLPPPREEIHEAMCALFVGASTVPTKENIKTLRPVLVSKTRVQLMLDFLLHRNSFYAAAGVTFSKDNLDSLFSGTDDEGIPDGVELCCLPDSTLETDGYADRGTDGPANAPRNAPANACGTSVTSFDDSNTVMEAVGYVVGERTPKDVRDMKASAVAWCLDRKNYIKMQAGSMFLSDRDPGFLTFCFPGLDPWGIGGFHEPNRTQSQKISFQQQVSNLLLQDDGVFQRDPNFAFAEINKQINFRTPQKTQNQVVADIQEMAPVITDLIRKWELNPNAKASNRAEKKAMRTLGRLKGSSGYKQCRRNKIRALIKRTGRRWTG
ncbi:hypothetical protein K438DRAFT_1902014 [Mycena galopus ATCC 62051]|nr:hypothetical protein K438DRAFT_1902014 [Mycena galopus ATCC 62051]